MNATDRILCEASDGIGWLTLNNPARRNAMSLDMWQGVADVLDRFEGDPAIRVAVIRGAGGKAFMSGADISQFGDHRKDAEQAEAYARVSVAGRTRIDTFAKPLIAMIQGFCIGGGLSVACLADLRVASDDSLFAIPAARLGLAYGADSLRKLVDLVGPAIAKELLFTARRLPATEALRVGLVNQVVPADALEQTVRELALGIADNAPLTIRAAKLAIDQLSLDPGHRDMARVEAAARACFDSRDYAEGRQAFLEKRKPLFDGR